MIKKLALLTLILAMALGACSKRSLEDSLGGTGGGGTAYSGDTRSAYTYLNYMYDPANGEVINKDVLDDQTYGLFRSDVQRVLNYSMQFPLQPQSKVGSNGDVAVNIDTQWYTTYPQEFYVSEYKKDIAKMLEVIMSKSLADGIYDTFIGVADTNLQRINTKVESILAKTVPGGGNIQLLINANVFSNASMIPQVFDCFGKGASLLTGGSIFSGLFGRGSGVDWNQVYTKLDAIMGKLDGMNVKLDTLITKVDDVKDEIVTGKLFDAKAMYKSVSALMMLKNSSPEFIKRQFENIFNDYNIANDQLVDAAQALLEIFWNKLNGQNKGQVVVPADNNYRMEITKKQKCDGNLGLCNNGETINFEYVPLINTMTMNHPLFYFINSSPDQKGVSLENLGFLRNYSLMRLAMLEKMLSGKELLYARNVYIKRYDLPIIQVLKNSLKQMVLNIEKSVNNYVPVYGSCSNYSSFVTVPPYGSIPASCYNSVQQYQEFIYPGSPIENRLFEQTNKLQKYNSDVKNWEYLNNDANSFSTEQSQVFNISSNNPVSGGSAFLVILINPIKVLSDEAAFQQFRKKLIAEYIATNHPAFKDYIVAYSAILAEWEMNLKAHLKAYENAN